MTLANEHLSQLTELINHRLAEFELDEMRAVAPGVVRTCHDVIVEWYQQKEESWAMQRISDVTITAEMAMKLTKQGYDLGYEEAERVLAGPLQSQGGKDEQEQQP